MTWIALDIGSSQWKAAVFGEDGNALGIVHQPIPLAQDQQGHRVVRPDDIMPVLIDLLSALPMEGKKAALGIAISGMAEGGLLLNAKTLQAETDLLPWFDNRGASTAAHLEKQGVFRNHFEVTGLPFSPKYSLFKILASLDEKGLNPEGVLWLGAPEYVAYLLTGSLGSEPSLAARSYVFDIEKGQLDARLLSKLGLPVKLFPDLVQSGSSMGQLHTWLAQETGLQPGLPVSICGHDHLCAADGADAFETGDVYCSAGTAQVLVKRKKEERLSRADQATGLSYGPQPRGGLCVLGALQSAGASVNWLKGLLYGGNGFDHMLAEADQMPDDPAHLIYLPYLTGSGPPRMSREARGAFVGLHPGSTRSELLQAVYQGLAFESRVILEAAGMSGKRMVVSGGLSAHAKYMQLLADCLHLKVEVPLCQEGTLYGAARLMARRAGRAFPAPEMGKTWLPGADRSEALDKLYLGSYLPLRQKHLDYYDTAVRN